MSTFLQSNFALGLARVVLTFVFWSAGLAKLIDFQGGMAEMAHFGLVPAAAFNMATIVVLLLGSAMLIFNRGAWLGAGMLMVFTALTIPIAHAFWEAQEPERTVQFHVTVEHISLIGGLMVAACLAQVQRRRT
jgi:transmembrane protein